jgi:UTP--glucose-1-phosphate uridylyltransferase
LVGCGRLSVVGDVVFGAGVVVRGTVEVAAANGGQLRVPDGAVLT